MKSALISLLLTVAPSVPAADLSCTITSNKDGPVAEAVISLIPLDAQTPLVPAGTTVEIGQQGQEFTAYVTVVQAGTKVVFPNRDTVQHHVYSLSKAKRFELPLYNPGQAESLVFELPGQVTVGCNIHDWMISHLIVVPTPYFAKSDDLGKTVLTAPAGRYRLELWHPRMSTPVIKEITLSDSSASQDAFTVALKPDRRVRRSLGSKTGGYR